MKFRLLAGKHAAPDPSGKMVQAIPPKMQAGPDGKLVEIDPGVRIAANVIYSPGAVIESEFDLCEMFNCRDPQYPKKFERVQEHEETSAAPISQLTFDPTKETLEEFNKRMLKLQQEGVWAPGTDKPAVVGPKDGLPQPPVGKVPPTQPDATLESMSQKELLQFAAEEEIDLRGAKTKEQLVQAIQHHQAARKAK
jgi:hypothetical protein